MHLYCSFLTTLNQFNFSTANFIRKTNGILSRREKEKKWTSSLWFDFNCFFWRHFCHRTWTFTKINVQFEIGAFIICIMTSTQFNFILYINIIYKMDIHAIHFIFHYKIKTYFYMGLSISTSTFGYFSSSMLIHWDSRSFNLFVCQLEINFSLSLECLRVRYKKKSPWFFCRTKAGN